MFLKTTGTNSEYEIFAEKKEKKINKNEYRYAWKGVKVIRRVWCSILQVLKIEKDQRERKWKREERMWDDIYF